MALAQGRRDPLPLRAMCSDGDGLGTATRWVDVNGILVHCLTAGGADYPVLLLHGPLAWARRAQECIPACELRVFSECRHLPLREHPEKFARVVERFLTR